MRLYYDNREEVADDMTFAMNMDEDFTMTPRMARLLLGSENRQYTKLRTGADEAYAIVREAMSEISSVIKLVVKSRSKADKAEIEDQLSGIINDLDYALEEIS